jgi:hypothetical protein
MPKTVKVTLGGTEYTIEELKAKANAAWRKRLGEQLQGVAELMDSDISDADTLRALAGLVMNRIMPAVDTMRDMLLDYCPAIRADRKRIEEEAYDSEIMDAFVKVLALAYPFGSAIQRISSLSGRGSPAK